MTTDQQLALNAQFPTHRPVVVDLPREAHRPHPAIARIVQRDLSRVRNIAGYRPCVGASRGERKAAGRYSSRCTYTKYENTVYVRNYVFLEDSASPRQALLMSDLIGDKPVVVKLPRGFHFSSQRSALSVVRNAGGVSCRVDTDMLVAGGRAVVTELMKLVRAEEAEKRAQRERRRMLRPRRLALITLTLGDSLLVNNCESGTRLLLQRVGIDPRQTLNGAGISAETVYTKARDAGIPEGLMQRLINTIAAAERRLTEVCI